MFKYVIINYMVADHIGRGVLMVACMVKCKAIVPIVLYCEESILLVRNTYLIRIDMPTIGNMNSFPDFLNLGSSSTNIFIYDKSFESVIMQFLV